MVWNRIGAAFSLCIAAALMAPQLGVVQAARAGEMSVAPATRGIEPAAQRFTPSLPPPTPRYLSAVKVEKVGVAVPHVTPTRPSRPRVGLAPSGALLYQGGAVLGSVGVYVDFWGSTWQHPSQAPVIAYIDGFFTDVGGSPWAGIMGQYCSGVARNSSSCPLGSASIQNPYGVLKNQLIDLRFLPASPTFQDLQAEAAAVAKSFGYPSGALVMIYTPSGVMEKDAGTGWCAYHSFTYAGGGIVPFGYMPYQPDQGWSCGANSVAGPLDGFSIVSGHEYAEAVTDPMPTTSPPGNGGWLDLVPYTEIGDKCAWQLKAVTMNGRIWPMQSLFSNELLALGRPQCVFGVPDAPTAVVASAGNSQATVSWTGPAANGGSAVTGYRVTPYKALVPQASTATGLATGTTVIGLTNGTAYTFTVAADSLDGTGAESSQSNSVIPLAPPGRPTGVIAAISGGGISVSWVAPLVTGGSAIVTYTVSCSPACTPQVVGASSRLAVFAGMQGGTAVTFTVVATNVAGPGLPSLPSNSVRGRDPVTQSSPTPPRPR
jgi:hypothetical protein